MKIHKLVFIIVHRNKMYIIILIIGILLFFEKLVQLSRTIYSIIPIDILSDPAIAGLIGAIFGGALSLMASVYTHRSQLRTKGIVVRKNVIYSPLYDDLIKFKDEFQNDNLKYPPNLTFDLKSTTQYRNTPKFEAWNRINKDVRTIEIPKYIRKGFSKLIKLGNEYLEEYQKTSVTVKEQLHLRLGDIDEFERLRTEVLGDRGIDNELLDHLLTSKQIPDELIRSELTWNDKLSEENLQKAKETLNDLYKIEGIYLTKEKFNSFEEQVEDMRQSLERLISFIQRKFEHKNRFY